MTTRARPASRRRPAGTRSGALHRSNPGMTPSDRLLGLRDARNEIAGPDELEPLIGGDRFNELAVRGEHWCVAGEAILAMRQQADDRAGSRHDLCRVLPKLCDRFRRIAEELQTPVAWKGYGDLPKIADSPRPCRCTAVVGDGK